MHIKTTTIDTTAYALMMAARRGPDRSGIDDARLPMMPTGWGWNAREPPHRRSSIAQTGVIYSSG